MRITKLLGTIIIFGLFSFPSMSAEYISTAIAKGFSWRYQRIQTGIAYEPCTIFSNIVIDSVWGSSADTLFFRVSERDSVIGGSTYTQTSHILCRKTNLVTQCDSSMVSEMFSDQAIVKYDSISVYGTQSFSKPVEIIFNEKQYTGIELGTRNNDPRSLYYDSSIFCDHIGFLKETRYITGMHMFTSSLSITLLSYNDKELSDTSGVKPTYTLKGTNGTIPAVYKIWAGSTNLNSGFNLLGQQRQSGNSGYGMRISRLLLHR